MKYPFSNRGQEKSTTFEGHLNRQSPVENLCKNCVLYYHPSKSFRSNSFFFHFAFHIFLVKRNDDISKFLDMNKLCISQVMLIWHALFLKILSSNEYIGTYLLCVYTEEL